MRISLGEYRIDAFIYVFGVFSLGFVKVRFNKVRSHLRSGYEPVSKGGTCLVLFLFIYQLSHCVWVRRMLSDDDPWALANRMLSSDVEWSSS